MTAAAALVLWLSATPQMAAAKENTLELSPAHGLPDSLVGVVPHIANFEFDCTVDWPQDPGWKAGDFTCGQPKGSSTFGSTTLRIPADAAAGPHQVRVEYSSSVVNYRIPSLFAEFTVDAPVTSTTSPDPPASDPVPPTASPAAPHTVRPAPAAPDDSPATTEPGTPDSTTSAAPAPRATTDPPVLSAVVDVARNLPLGLALLATVIALAAAIATPRLVRALRRRTPRWVARNLRVAVEKGIPRTFAPAARSGPATTVRLAVQVEPRPEPRKEGR
ncbi:MAG TPA: hypothetical protein VGP26_10175 [Actinophytocola sp.]|nr:hypothetical protein [Actinophytocola sp.]